MRCHECRADRSDGTENIRFSSSVPPAEDTCTCMKTLGGGKTPVQIGGDAGINKSSFSDKKRSDQRRYNKGNLRCVGVTRQGGGMLLP